jgi:hypothetical protein
MEKPDARDVPVASCRHLRVTPRIRYSRAIEDNNLGDLATCIYRVCLDPRLTRGIRWTPADLSRRPTPNSRLRDLR